jgi:hypothetical protein
MRLGLVLVELAAPFEPLGGIEGAVDEDVVGDLARAILLQGERVLDRAGLLAAPLDAPALGLLDQPGCGTDARLGEVPDLAEDEGRVGFVGQKIPL